MPKKVFISYRRTDSLWATHHLYDTLLTVLPKDHVFMDEDAIPLGIDFVAFLGNWVRQCDLLLAVIGPGWLEAKDPKTGLRRLDNDRDFVRIEIRLALERNIPVVPVLLDTANMPMNALLPEDIQPLARRNAAKIHRRTAASDLRDLIKRLGLVDTPSPHPNPQAPAVNEVSGRSHSSPRFPVPEMVRIAPGSFLMGSDPSEPGAQTDEAPQHRVTVTYPFEFGRYAVTFDEYDAFCRLAERQTA